MPTITNIQAAGFPERLQRVDFSAPGDGTTAPAEDWAIMIPPKDSRDKTWIVSIHGHGANGRQLFVRSDVKRTWLPNFLASGHGILSPNLRGSRWMDSIAAGDLDFLLDWLRQEYGAERFLFHSGSMGGTATLLYALHAPKNVTAMAIFGCTCDMTDYYWFCRKGAKSIAVLDEIVQTLENLYGGGPNQCPEKYIEASSICDLKQFKGIPFFLCHGAEDILMPVHQARLIAAELKDAPHFLYHELANQGHDGPMLHPFNAIEWIDRELMS